MYPKIKIEFTTLDTTAEARIEYVSASPQINLSNAPYIAIPQNSNPLKKGFQLSPNSSTVVSPLNGRYTYFGSDGYPGFASKTLYGGSAIDATVTFRINNVVPTQLYITFDTASGEYAPSYYLSNNQNAYVVNVSDNNSVVSAVSITSMGLTPGAQVTLHITSWSTLNKSIKVTNISGLSYIYEMYGSSLIDFKCSENLMDSQLSVEPGICEQYANITVYDRGNILRDRAMRGTLEDDAQVTLSSVDNSVETILGTYFVSEWNVNSNSSNVIINCRDKSYIFSKINVARSTIATRSVHDLLVTLFAYATNISWQYKDVDTQTRCEQIVIPNSWWLASDLYTMLNKICAVGMLRIYWYIDRFIVGRCV